MSKLELRRHYRLMRRTTTAPLQRALDCAGADLLQQVLRQAPCPEQRLALFMPLEGEVDLRPWLGACGLPLALPAVVEGQLLFRPWQLGDPLGNDACGIPAPLASVPALAPRQIALLLVPALAIDHQGVRLGYGGGWYDRLRAEPRWRRVPALAVLPASCVCDRLPQDPWDVPFDGWLDEHGLHWI